MKKLGLILLSCSVYLCSIAQDTVVVNTLNFSSTTRDTIISFPDTDVSYRKILMQYSMRCKGARVSSGSNRNLGCGEWDYSCNTYIEDSSRVDSLLSTTNEYSISGFTGTTYNYKETPLNDYYRNTSITTQINGSSGLDTAIIGDGTVSTNLGIPGTLGGVQARFQHLFTAKELISAGLSAGNIWGIVINATNSMEVSDLRMNLKHYAQGSLNLKSIELGGFDNVFSNTYEFTTGSNQIQFHTPMMWDGTSNILLEFTSSKSIGFQELTVNSSFQDTTRSMVSTGGGYIDFDGTNYLESESYEGVLSSQNRTCEAWIKTTGANQEIVGWGKNVSGQKWVFRTNTDGSLRVEVNGGAINATTPVNDDKWHHVVCVLDGSNVSDIKFYVDGTLENISATADLAINTIADIKLRISRGIDERYFVGSMDDIRIWDIALTQNDIQELMRQRSQSIDANFDNLKAYFRFEPVSFKRDDSNTGASGIISGEEKKGEHRAPTLFKDFVYSTNRPNIGWITGDFNVSNSTTYSFDEVAHSSNLVKKYAIQPAYNTIINDVIIEIESTERWNTDDEEIYFDDYNLEYDRIKATPDGTIEINKLNYIRRWPSRLEIMSFVTPYGIGLDLGIEGKTWTFDVTDFTPILTGDKRMFLSRGGQNQEEMDIKFLFIRGTPAREVLDIKQIWPTQQYQPNFSQILANDVYFPPVAFKTTDSAKSFKVRSAITGHGQQGEFIPRNHFIKANNQNFERSVWKICGKNPVYPQGGTWIYDRAGWCPGMATDLAEYEITDIAGGEAISLDYGIANGDGDSRYIVNNQIVSYGEYNYGYDLEIVDIMEPSNEVVHALNNPMCINPKIKVRNNGMNTVNSITIEYWVNDESNKRSFIWPCYLSNNGVEEINFPVDNSIWSSAVSGNSRFYAKIVAIDGNVGVDEDASNNTYVSDFDFPEVYPGNFFLFYRTNNAASENQIKIEDEWGTIVFQRDNHVNSTIYRDTLNLGLGCYKLTIDDSGNDGISFWANNDGSGYFRLWEVGGSIFKTIQPDFGSQSIVNFTVVHTLDVPKYEVDLGYQLYPNPTTGHITVNGGDMKGAVPTLYNAMGQEINAPSQVSESTLTYNLNEYPSGIYFLSIVKNEHTWTQKIIKN
jgi:hypothetical protein